MVQGPSSWQLRLFSFLPSPSASFVGGWSFVRCRDRLDPDGFAFAPYAAHSTQPTSTTATRRRGCGCVERTAIILLACGYAYMYVWVCVDRRRQTDAEGKNDIASMIWEQRPVKF